MKDFPIFNMNLDEVVAFAIDILDDMSYGLYQFGNDNYDDIDDSYNSILFETIEEAEDELYDICLKFNNISKQNKIKIYRSIHINSIEDLNEEDLGECWAFDEKAARTFGYMNVESPIFLMKGLTNSNNINWIESLKRYIINSLGHYGDEENELVIKDSYNVKVLDVIKI